MTTAAQPHHRENDFAEVHHVYEPHLVGLPPIAPYLREAWRRRTFAYELARTKLRSHHYNTVFGMLWLVLNPLLLAGVYFILVDILRAGDRGEDFFAHLMAGIFAYYFVSGAVRNGTKSVVSGCRLILRTASPSSTRPMGRTTGGRRSSGMSTGWRSTAGWCRLPAARPQPPGTHGD